MVPPRQVVALSMAMLVTMTVQRCFRPGAWPLVLGTPSKFLKIADTPRA